MGIQGTVNDWRKDMLKNLIDRSDNGANKVQWCTAGDQHVCHLCLQRNGKVYTFEQAKRELEGEFCKPNDPDDRCRCVFLPVID